MNIASELRPLLIALTIALGNGLLYVFIAPPWQHYDEPTHFEYAKLIAERGHLPLPGDVDVQMRADIYNSMSRYGFFGPTRPTAPTDGSAANIGITQLGDSPLYYIYSAIAIGLAHDASASIETQLYAGRIVSLLFLLITVACGWGVAARLTQPGHRLRWMLPSTLALIPAFVDLMSAVNNDGLAIAAYSFFLLGAVRWLHARDGERGPYHFLNALWMLVAAGLCYAAKSTAVTAVPIALLALVIGLFERRARAVVAGAICIAALAATPFLFQRGDARGWYRNDASRASQPIRCDAAACGGAVGDGYAIRVSPGASPYALAHVYQSFPPANTAKIRDQVVRVSARIWTTSDTAVGNNAPWLGINHSAGNSPQITLSRTPLELSYTTTVPLAAHYIRLVLPGHTSATVVYDDVRVQPVGGESVRDIEAGDALFDAVRFGTGDAEALALREPVMRVLDAVSPEWYSWPLTISALQDLRGTGWYFLVVSRYMFETLWLRVAWGGLMPPDVWLLLPIVLTALAVVGAILGLPHYLRNRFATTIALLGLCLVVTLGPTVPRAIIWGLEERMYAPPIRYALPGVVAISMLLSSGWATLFARVSTRTTVALFGLIAVILNTTVLYTIGASLLG